MLPQASQPIYNPKPLKHTTLVSLAKRIPTRYRSALSHYLGVAAQVRNLPITGTKKPSSRSLEISGLRFFAQYIQNPISHPSTSCQQCQSKTIHTRVRFTNLKYRQSLALILLKFRQHRTFEITNSIEQQAEEPQTEQESFMSCVGLKKSCEPETLDQETENDTSVPSAQISFELTTHSELSSQPTVDTQQDATHTHKHSSEEPAYSGLHKKRKPTKPPLCKLITRIRLTPEERKIFLKLKFEQLETIERTSLLNSIKYKLISIDQVYLQQNPNKNRSHNIIYITLPLIQKEQTYETKQDIWEREFISKMPTNNTTDPIISSTGLSKIRCARPFLKKASPELIQHIFSITNFNISLDNYIAAREMAKKASSSTFSLQGFILFFPGIASAQKGRWTYDGLIHPSFKLASLAYLKITRGQNKSQVLTHEELQLFNNLKHGHIDSVQQLEDTAFALYKKLSSGVLHKNLNKAAESLLSKGITE